MAEEKKLKIPLSEGLKRFVKQPLTLSSSTSTAPAPAPRKLEVPTLGLRTRVEVPTLEKVEKEERESEELSFKTCTEECSITPLLPPAPAPAPVLEQLEDRPEPTCYQEMDPVDQVEKEAPASEMAVDAEDDVKDSAVEKEVESIDKLAEAYDRGFNDGVESLKALMLALLSKQDSDGARCFLKDISSFNKKY